MADVSTTASKPELDLNPYRRLRQALQDLIAACEQIVNGGAAGPANAAFEHVDEVGDVHELALGCWVTGELWAAKCAFHLDVLDDIASGTIPPAPPDDAPPDDAPAPIARPAADADAELPPARARPYWLQ